MKTKELKIVLLLMLAFVVKDLHLFMSQSQMDVSPFPFNDITLNIQWYVFDICEILHKFILLLSIYKMVAGIYYKKIVIVLMIAIGIELLFYLAGYGRWIIEKDIVLFIIFITLISKK